MNLPAWSISVLQSILFQQTAPFIVLFLIPTLFFLLSTRLRRFFSHNFFMGIESWGLSLPWLWSSSQTGKSSSTSHRRSKRKNATGSSSRHKGSGTDPQQIALKTVRHNDASDSELESAQYYPGLVNISGTYCFMNSTLQALASLTYLQPQIDAIHAKAEYLDVPTPTIDALHELFNDLNTPKSSYHSLRPHRIIAALSSPYPFAPSYDSSSNSDISRRSSTSSALFNSREHQDAQELFQLVSECIRNEMGAVEKEGLRDRGIAGVLDFGSESTSKRMNAENGSFTGLGSQNKLFAPNDNQHQKVDDARSWSLGSSSSLTIKSVFDGLTANRRSCVKCGYTEAVMHFGFDNWQLSVPRLATSCRLEDCLEEYTRLEILKDCVCRKCSVLATHRRLLQELKTLEDALDLVPRRLPTSPSNTNSSRPGPSSSAASSSSASTSMPSTPSKPKPSASKKRRYKEVKHMEQSVCTALSEGRIEDENLLTGVRLERVVSPASTKQAMIARPPPVLALHLNRSLHYGQFVSKNTIKVHFPEVLDLSPYITSGSLSTVPTSAISTPSPPLPSLQTSLFQTPLSSLSPPSIEQKTHSTKSKKRSTTPTSDTYRGLSSSSPSPPPETQRTIYRLTAVVCHYGQHSFGHYICYRRKPRISRDRRNLAGDVPVLVMPEVNSTTSMMNGSADSYSTASQPSSTYHWQDHSENFAGSGKGWLRISDDSVRECGIESVLAEGSGAFMLYYERAVWGTGWMNSKEKAREKTPVIGIGRRNRLDGKGDFDHVDDGEDDGDRFSIGSEETLRPKSKVMDLNGSVGSLVSEVGVGIMKQKKDGKCGHGLGMKDEATDSEFSMILSANPNLYASSVSSSVSSTISSVGPRIVRSVNAGRGHSVGMNRSEMASVGPLANGTSTQHGTRDDSTEEDMSASAPPILQASNNSAAVKPYNRMSLGSKSTKMTMHHASTTANPGVKAP